MSVDSSGNGHRLKQLSLRDRRKAFSGVYNVVKDSDVWEIWRKRLDRLGQNCVHIMQMDLGMDTGLKRK